MFKLALYECSDVGMLPFEAWKKTLLLRLSIKLGDGKGKDDFEQTLLRLDVNEEVMQSQLTQRLRV